MNDLPGVVISTIFLFIVDIKILSIQAASVVAASGQASFFFFVTGSTTVCIDYMRVLLALRCVNSSFK
jgi:hypothetical protein